MTSIDAPAHDRVEALQAEGEPTGAPSPRLRLVVRRVNVIAAGGLVAILIGWVVFALFEGPLAREWYTLRQHQLASEFAAARPHVGRGAAIALLQIPRLRVNVLVADGDSPQQLRSGPGHRIGTPLPGDVGNSVIVGHHADWGGPFSKLATLHKGDHIVVQTRDAGIVRNGAFSVEEVRRVAGDDATPFSGSTDHRLTIMTGDGGRFSHGRVVVTAVSGTVGTVLAPPAEVVTTTPADSWLRNGEVLLGLFCLAAAVAIVGWSRRRYRTLAIVTVVVPLAALGLIGALLDVDAMLPVPR